MGTHVDVNSAQALTNKTLTDPTNAVRATALASDGGGSITLSGSATVGKALVATGASTAEWTNINTLPYAINLKDFCAGDGTTIDNAGFTSALAASNGKLLVIPAGTYRLTTTFNAGAWSGDIEAVPGAVLSFTGVAGNGTLLNFASVYGTSKVLVGDATAGDTSVTLNNVTGLTVGSFIEFFSTDNWSTNTNEGDIEKGEWCLIKSISGSTVTFMRPLLDSYSFLTTEVKPITTASSPRLRGLTIVGPGNNQVITGVNFSRCINPVAENMTIRDTPDSGLRVENCVGARINRVTATGFTDTSVSTGTQYGVVVGGGDDTLITGCHLEGGRHAVAIGGAPSYGPSRHVTVSDSFLATYWGGAAADCHGQGQFITYRNNTIYGMIMAGDDVVIEGNTIYATTGGSCLAGRSDISSYSVIVRNNYFIRDRGSNIAVFLGSASAAPGRASKVCIFENNIIDMRGGTANDVLSLNNNSAFALEGLIIRGIHVIGNVALMDRIETIMPEVTGMKFLIMEDISLPSGRIRIRSPVDRLIVRDVTITDGDSNIGLHIEGDVLPTGASFGTSITVESVYVDGAVDTGILIRGAEASSANKPNLYLRDVVVNNLNGVAVNGLIVGAVKHCSLSNVELRDEKGSPTFVSAYSIESTVDTLAMTNVRMTGVSNTSVLAGAISGVQTVTAADTVKLDSRYIFASAAAPYTLLLPTASDAKGQGPYFIKKTDANANAITVDASGSETIDGATTVVLDAQYESCLIISTGTAWLRLA